MQIKIDVVFLIRFLGILVIIFGIVEASLILTSPDEDTEVKWGFIVFFDKVYLPLALGSVIIALSEIVKNINKSKSD